MSDAHVGRAKPWLPWWPFQVATSAALAAVVIVAVTTWRQRVARAADATVPVHESPGFTHERPHGMLDLESALYLLRPAELGTKAWELGQFASYALWSESEPTPDGAPAERTLRISVLRAADPEDAFPARFGLPYPDLAWLRFEGMNAFRGKPVDAYRLASPHDLAIGPAMPFAEFQDGYIPFVTNEAPPLSPRSVELRSVGEETIEVAGERLTCSKLDVVLSATLEQAEERVATLWHHPDVAPLGVVRFETMHDRIELVEYGVGAPEYPETIAPLVDGLSVFAELCHSCHGETCHESVYPPH